MVSMCVGLLEEVPLAAPLQLLFLAACNLLRFEPPLRPSTRPHCDRCCSRLFFGFHLHRARDEPYLPLAERNNGEAHSNNIIPTFEIAMKVGKSADLRIHHQRLDLSGVVLARGFPVARELPTRPAFLQALGFDSAN